MVPRLLIEISAGKPLVVRGRAGDRVNLSEGRIHHAPDNRLIGIRHPLW